MLIFDDKNNIDYSSAVIEWCKAVELETYYKLTSKIKRYEDEINRELDGKTFEFRSTIGVFNTIEKIQMRDGRTMRQFLFDEYYSKFYEWNLEKYNDLIDNILKIYETRNNSAHKDRSINFKDAKCCQSIILSAEKILEILSKLEKKK